MLERVEGLLERYGVLNVGQFVVRTAEDGLPEFLLDLADHYVVFGCILVNFILLVGQSALVVVPVADNRSLDSASP